MTAPRQPRPAGSQFQRVTPGSGDLREFISAVLAAGAVTAITAAVWHHVHDSPASSS